MSASCLRCPNLNCRCEFEICPPVTYRVVLFFSQAFLNWINSPVSFVAGTQIAITGYRFEQGLMTPVTLTVIGNVPISYSDMAKAFSSLGWEIQDLNKVKIIPANANGAFLAVLRPLSEIISHVIIHDTVGGSPPFSIELPINFSEVEVCDASNYKFREPSVNIRSVQL